MLVSCAMQNGMPTLLAAFHGQAKACPTKVMRVPGGAYFKLARKGQNLDRTTPVFAVPRFGRLIQYTTIRP